MRSRPGWPPYWFVFMAISPLAQSRTKDSNTLDRKFVQAIFRHWSTLAGALVLGITDTYSVDHFSAHFFFSIMLLNTAVTGAASSAAYILKSLCGISPGTMDVGLLSLIILSRTCSVVMVGGLFLYDSGISSCCSGSYPSLILL